jgi:hypothetical protein
LTDPRRAPAPRNDTDGGPVADAPGSSPAEGPEVMDAGAPEDLDALDVGRPSLVGNLIADRYLVERLLGIGGMGAVYYAEHVAMQKPVAVKVLHRQLVALPEVVARFEREAIAAGRINDPHVVTATDFGRLADGSFYLALEYVEGTGLGQVLRSGPLGSVRALKIARQILQALAAAHAAGIVHRDLKPENVMLVARAEDPDFVKVLDFGIAKIGDGGGGTGRQTPAGVLTRMGSVFGTPQYMSPEQAAGQAVDARADLYTLGLILYEMLAGQPPFVADEISRVLAMHLTQPPPPLPESVEPAVAAAVMHLLAKHPDDRPQTAEEAIARVDQALRSLGVSHPSFAAILLDDDGGYLEVGSGPRRAGTGALEVSPISSSAVAPEPVPVAQAPAPVRRHGVPLWVLVAAVSAALGLAAAALFLQWSGARAAASGGASARVVPSGPPSAIGALAPDLAVLLARATLGNRDALAVLEARPAGSRSSPEWVALARGRMATGAVKPAFEAYLAALELDPTVADDPTFREHLRHFAQDDETSDAALRLAAARLGAPGADLLYEVWVNTRAKNTRTQLAKQLVYSAAVRSKASPALNAVLDLRAALEGHEGLELPNEGACTELKRMLPGLTLHGDQRAVRVLAPLTRKSGCGPRSAEDCYPCLRDGSGLTDALAAARTRSGP